MTNQISKFLDRIRKDAQLEDCLSCRCGFELADKEQLEDDLGFLLEGGSINYEAEPFACDGAGGLVRAYSHSASLAVNEAGIVKMVMCKKLSVTCDYSDYGRVAAIVPECGGALENTQFTDVVRMTVNIVPEMVGTMMKKLADATAGSALVDEMGELFCEFPIED